MLDRMLDISAWVQEKREGLGLTQKAFAELLGMPETGERTVRGWELGDTFQLLLNVLRLITCQIQPF